MSLILIKQEISVRFLQLSKSFIMLELSHSSLIMLNKILIQNFDQTQPCDNSKYISTNELVVCLKNNCILLLFAAQRCSLIFHNKACHIISYLLDKSLYLLNLVYLSLLEKTQVLIKESLYSLLDYVRLLLCCLINFFFNLPFFRHCTLSLRISCILILLLLYL